MSADQLSFDDYRRHTGRGGPRAGAGRPRGRRSIVYHVRREQMPRDCPAHVTLRIREGLPSLRRLSFVKELRRSFAAACERGDFRVTQFSVQRDHLHLLVEAAGKHALGRGMKSISARVARAVNRVFRQSGAVLLGRYHVRALRTPREVRNALAYVLLNARKHWRQRTGVAPPMKLDEASSAAWFDGWRRRRWPLPSADRPPIAPPRTWLLRAGWRRHGLLDPSEVPGQR
ncbi:MAG TPA: transposase [Myxococcota bacterium]|nr:transposase [Myxococcota bacterium]